MNTDEHFDTPHARFGRLAAISLLLLPVAGLRAAPVALTGASGSYTQRFDTLVSSGSGEWIAETTLPGWYVERVSGASIDTYTASTGSSTSGNVYSFGSSGNSDRALGSIGSNVINDYRWGVVLRNDTGATIVRLRVAYAGEQWRNSAAAAQSIAFSYLISAESPTLSSPGFRTVPQLAFSSPVTGGSAGALNGNDSANRVLLDATMDVNLPPGAYLLLRWHDPDHAGTDHGLAIDDLVFDWQCGTYAGVTVPLRGTTENFACLGSEATGGLPEGWRVKKSSSVRTVESYESATNLTERSAAANMDDSSGIYNFGDAANAADRAVGGLSSGSAAKSVSVYVKCQNLTGRTITRWRVRYKVEKYRQGTNAAGFRMQLLVSANGSVWTAVEPDTFFGADAVNAGYADAPGASVAEERIVSQAVPADGVFYLAWSYSVASGSTTTFAQALGIDDVEILPWQPETIVIVR